MKENVLMVNEDIDYSKRFCSQANRLYGDKYLFLYFSNLKSIKEYIEENKVRNIIISDIMLDSIDDISAGRFFVLDDKEKSVISDGKRVHIYKLQNIKNILKVIDEDIEKNQSEKKTSKKSRAKLISFYATEYQKNKLEIIKRIAKYISKKKKVLIVDFDEFENYKGKLGLSNIIYKYKEGHLDANCIEKEIETEKNQEIIKSTTYPEDFNVVSNIDLANIVSEIAELPYDYIFVNLDMSYVKSEYVIVDSDLIFLLKEEKSNRVNAIKMYLHNENQVDNKKIYELSIDKIDRAYLLNFIKIAFGEKDGKE